MKKKDCCIWSELKKINSSQFLIKFLTKYGAKGLTQAKSLLLIDSVKSHTCEKSTVNFDYMNTKTKIIGGGMTIMLQFLNTHIIKPFKNGLAEKLAEWKGKWSTQLRETVKRLLMKQLLSGYTMYGTWLLRTIFLSKGFNNVGTSILMVIKTHCIRAFVTQMWTEKFLLISFCSLMKRY